MAMEKPSICSDSDGVLDIAINDKTGYLFKVKDGKDLVVKLDKLILDVNKRIAFGVNARKRVKDIFEIEKITNQTIKYYSELIEIKK